MAAKPAKAAAKAAPKKTVDELRAEFVDAIAYRFRGNIPEAHEYCNALDEIKAESTPDVPAEE